MFLQTPASEPLLRAAMRDARVVYGRDAMNLVEVKKWLARNPLVIAVLYSDAGRYMGYFDLVPLTKRGMEILRSGEHYENEIPPGEIVTPASMKRAHALYLASIVARRSGTRKGHEVAVRLFNGLARYLEYYYGGTARPGIALAATADGERVMKRFRAKLVSPATTRKDGHNLYEFQVTPKLIRRIKERTERKATPPVVLLSPPDSRAMDLSSRPDGVPTS